MKYLLDTHLLIWIASEPEKISAALWPILIDETHELFWSSASLWEVAIKFALGRPAFIVDPRLLREGLRRHGYFELPVNGSHALAVADLPLLHGDPFDRILIAQATVEQMILLTCDEKVVLYPGPIQEV